MILGLLASALAQSPVPLDGDPWTRAWLVPRDGKAVLLLADGDQPLRVVDPRNGQVIQRLATTASDVVVEDLDGDGRKDLLTCGQTGLKSLPWENASATLVLSDAPCRAVAIVYADRTLAVSAGERLNRYALGIGGPLDLGPFGEALPEGPLQLTASGDMLAVITDRRLALWGPRGEHVQRTQDPIDGVVRTDAGWAWTAGGQVFGTASGLWFSDARQLVMTDLDADGERAPMVIHPTSQLVGSSVDGGERATPLTFTPRRLLTGDVDGDEGNDVVVVGDQWVQVFGAAGAPPRHQLTRQELAPAPTRPLLGVPVPLFQATDGSLASGSPAPTRSIVGGAGISLGSPLAGGIQLLGGSPAGLVAIEQMQGRTHLWLGMDTAPLLLGIGADNGLAWHLAYLSAGAGFGNAHLRAGPFVTAGIIGAGGGLRVVWTPFETRSGVLHGLEWRAQTVVGVTGRDGPNPMGEATLAYITSVPMGGRRHRERAIHQVVPSSAERRTEGYGICRRFGFSFGVAGGGSSVENSWAFVGQPLQLDVTATPAVSGWCESGVGSGAVFASLDSAPWFRYRIPWDDGTRDVTVRQMASATMGFMLGNDLARVGPIGTAGVWALGGGLRGALTPFDIKGAGHHGIEARALVLEPSASSWQVSLLYTTWFDPRR